MSTKPVFHNLWPTTIMSVNLPGAEMANASLTEFINVSTQHVAIAPRKISPAQIAVTPLTLLTAYQSLRDGGYY